MHLLHTFLFQPVGKTYMGVPVGESASQFHGLLQLNEVGYDIVSQLKDDITRDELIERLLKVYDIDRDTLTPYVDQVISYLREQQVLSE